MQNWLYQGNPILFIDQFPEGSIGFIYKIINKETDGFYIGKKNLYSTRNIALGKKELAAITDKRRSKKKKVIKESDWLTYHGSEPSLKKDIEFYGSDNFHREILHICFNKKSLTYQEIRYQILNSCLEDEYSYNSNIIGKFFIKDAE